MSFDTCRVHGDAHPATWLVWRFGPDFQAYEVFCDEAMLGAFQRLVREDEPEQTDMTVVRLRPGLPIPPARGHRTDL